MLLTTELLRTEILKLINYLLSNFLIHFSLLPTHFKQLENYKNNSVNKKTPQKIFANLGKPKRANKKWRSMKNCNEHCNNKKNLNKKKEKISNMVR